MTKRMLLSFVMIRDHVVEPDESRRDWEFAKFKERERVLYRQFFLDHQIIHI